MAERVELYSTPEGGEHTKPTEEVKKAAWDLAQSLGVKEDAKMSYVRGTGTYVMTLGDGVPADKVEAFKEGTSQFRTDEAKAELAANLDTIKADAAASKADAEKAPPKEKAAKEPELPRSDVLIYTLPVGKDEVREGQSQGKAESYKMLSEADRVIAEQGLKGTVKNSYDKENDVWRMGGRGLSEETVKGLEDAMAQYRTPEAKAHWESGAEARAADREANRSTGAKGMPEAEGPDVSGMAKGGAER